MEMGRIIGSDSETGEDVNFKTDALRWYTTNLRMMLKPANVNVEVKFVFTTFVGHRVSHSVQLLYQKSVVL